MPLSEIDGYTKLENYHNDCVKRIETIGVVKPVKAGLAKLLSTNDNVETELTLDITNLSIEYAYPKVSEGIPTLRVRIIIYNTNFFKRQIKFFITFLFFIFIYFLFRRMLGR